MHAHADWTFHGSIVVLGTISIVHDDGSPDKVILKRATLHRGDGGASEVRRGGSRGLPLLTPPTRLRVRTSSLP